MPWNAKKFLILIICAFAMWAIAVTVFVRDRSLDTKLLAVVSFVGGVAIILNNLPENGKDKEKK